MLVCAAAGAGVTALGAFSGGFYAQSWGWAALACLAVVLGSLVWSRPAGLPRSAWCFLGALAGFTTWVGITAFRPGAATLAVPELERNALYVLVVWAGLVASRRAADAAEAVVAGLLAGIVIVSCWGLGLFLFPHHAPPDQYEGRLLFEPVGYANAMGILAAMGVLLALARAVHGRSAGARALSAGALAPLAATLWFAQSVGAAVALAAGLAAMVGLDPLRRRLVATAAVTVPLPLVVVWLGSRSPLGDSQATAGTLIRSGHVFAVALVLVALATAAIAFVLLRNEQLARIEGPAAVVVGSVFIAVIAVAAAKAHTPAPGDRIAYWRAALADIRAHPLLGSGPGSFEAAWLRFRTSPVATRDAHNLYLETLAELGPLGLVLVLGALFVPLRSLILRPRRPATTAAGAAYIAFLVHAAFDWDWELPAVVVVGLLCGLVLVAQREAILQRGVGRRTRAIAAAIALVCAVPATIGLIGNHALAAAEHAASTGDWTTAERQARVAATWQPWSAQPRLLLGLGQLADGDAAAARASFARAVRLDPTDARAWYELGSVSGKTMRDEALRRLLALDPVGTRTG